MTRFLYLIALAACAQPREVAPDAAPDGSPDGSPAEHGLRAVYFAAALDRSDERIEPVDGALDGGSARWTGIIDAPPGDYAFAVTGADGARLWIDGARVLDAWLAPSPAFVDVALAGPAAIKITAFARGSAHVSLRWRRPDGTEEVVPTAVFTPAAEDARAAPPWPYTNPVDDLPCADPGVLAHGDAYYLACTGGRFRVQRSRDLETWTPTQTYVLPAGGAPWSASTEFRWAPELHDVGATTVAYFVSADGGGKRAIGAAVAASPAGPFTVQPAPLVTDPIGAIDPSYFEDTDGKRYLLWKVAGNSVGQPTPIFLRELGADGLHFAAGSAPIELIRNAPATWEGPLVEAPWLVKRGGSYYLFYSGNIYDERYRVGVARAANVRGPYAKHGAPILANNAKWLGPGHQAVVSAGGLDYLVYHAWPVLPSGALDDRRGRLLMMDRIAWVDGWPVIDGDGTPSRSARSRPGLDPDE